MRGVVALSLCLCACLGACVQPSVPADPEPCTDEIGCGVVSFGCASTEDCGAGNVCFNARCYAACEMDVACDLGLVCSDGRCVAGCRSDAECKAGEELCLAKTCTQIDPAWLPSITFAPQSIIYYVGEPQPPPAVATIAPGVHDSAPLEITVPAIHAHITQQDLAFTLQDTQATGDFSVTVSAKGRAGTASATYTFQVRTDAIYTYLAPVGGGPAGIYSVQSDGTQLSLFDADFDDGNQATRESAARAGDFGFLSRPGGVAYYVAIGDSGTAAAWNRYELRTGEDRAWFQTHSHQSEGDCRVGANTSGNRTCAYPLTSLSSDAAGRKLALQIGKMDPTQTNYLFDLVHRPSAIIVIDTSATPARLDYTTGTAPSSGNGVTVFSVVDEPTSVIPVGGVPQTPKSSLSTPSLSADGERLLVLETTRDACPNGGCGDNRGCTSVTAADGICEPRACSNDDQCTGCAQSKSCTSDGDCPAGSCVRVSPSDTSGHCDQCAAGEALRHLATGRDLCCVGTNGATGTTGKVGTCSACTQRKSCGGLFSSPCPNDRACINEASVPSGKFCGCLPGETEKIIGNTRECCTNSGGGFCAASACIPSANPAETGCPTDSVCVASPLGGNATCIPKATQRFQLFDPAIPGTPVRSGPAASITQAQSSDADGSVFGISSGNLFPTLMDEERVVYFSTPGLSSIVQAVAATGITGILSGYSSNLVEVRMTDASLDPTTSTLISPRSYGTTYQAADYLTYAYLTSLAPRNKEAACVTACDDPAMVTQDYTCTCPTRTPPSGSTGPTGYTGCADATQTGAAGAAELAEKRRCCRVKCFDDCAQHYASGAMFLTLEGLYADPTLSWCEARVAEGTTKVEAVAPYWVARSGDARHLLIVQVGMSAPFTLTSTTCQADHLRDGYCGAEPSSPSEWDGAFALPTAPSGSPTRLLLLDADTGDTRDLLDSDAFRAFLSGNNGALRIGDPHFIADGRQVAFMGQGEALKDPANADMPSSSGASQLFIVNADASNPRRVLDQRHASNINVPGYWGIIGVANCRQCSCGQTHETGIVDLALDWAWLFFSVVVVRTLTARRKRSST